MPIDKKTVEHLARLSRIELPANELEKLSRQLQDILDFIDQLKKLDVKEVNPTSHILPINNIFRDDILKESLPCEKALENAPQQKKNFFVVPKVIE